MMDRPSIQSCINTSEDNLRRILYEPCLEWANRFDRGVGFFTSGWIANNSRGMASFASKNGKARWVTSPIIDSRDYEVIRNAASDRDIADHFRGILLEQIDSLAEEIESETLNAFSWMIFDGIIELKFAFPTKKLSGDFHDKFGIFYNGVDYLTFSGSINDSAKGFTNYESVKVFRSWDETVSYAQYDVERFVRIWNNADENLTVISSDQAIKDKLIKLRTGERPYKKKKSEATDSRWIHQDEAVETFLRQKNGILEMATGTGKTRTAIKIIKQLFQRESINKVIITTYGNDLLKQWVTECLKSFDAEVLIYKYFDSFHQLPSFLLSSKKSILIISRDADRLYECISRLRQRISNSDNMCIFVFDEVHGFGARSFQRTLSGVVSPYRYRLGLSATPEREYDDEGNRFIENEVGPIVFRFGLEDAIKRGILCEFSYFPIEYTLTDEDKRRKRSIIASYSAKRASGEFVNDEDMYRDLARVNKVSPAKLPLFESFVREHPRILDRCIIFVETKDYGEDVQRILIKYCPDYHTYYGDDDSDNLDRFAVGELDCLVTCKKISEGIDIKTVKNIILFSSDRSSLVTTQRIGRSLRIDPLDPQKHANVVDFICPGAEESAIPDLLNADEERQAWLTGLSQVRRETE